MAKQSWIGIVALVAGCCCGTSAAYSFCPDGMVKPNFTEGEIVEVTFAQAPLFSLDPAIGQDLKEINLFHTSVVLSQGAGHHRQYWTLEFGFMLPSPLSTMAPEIIVNESAPGGYSMVWHNDARYCLTYGLLHGRKHWTMHLDIVTSVSAESALRAFDEFVAPLNSTKIGSSPQYNNFKVLHAGLFGRAKKTFVDDLTCNHGALWFIHYLASIGNAIPQDFKFKGTVAVVNAWSARRITPDQREWVYVLNYFKKMNDLISANKSHARKFLDVIELVAERHYTYDPNSGEYYELFGNFFPWVNFQYDELQLAGPWWMEKSSSSTLIV